MKEFKGTKGEWRYSKEHECITTSRVGIVEGSKIICNLNTSVSFDYSGVELEKNAKLISAAPELLKVAEMAFMLSNMIQFPCERELNELLEASRNAINKALK